MTPRTSFTFVLSPPEQATLQGVLEAGNYLPTNVPHTRFAYRTPRCAVNLYNSGKCLVQGSGAEEFVTFVMEPQVLGRAGVGYEEVMSPEEYSPHMGVDESGKGDLFGPLVIAAAYVDEDSARALKALNVRDSKAISGDDRARALARELRGRLARRHAVVRIGPAAYNRLYAKMGNVNRMLGWGHARAIENLLETVPGCPVAISDQFGRKDQIERALLQKGRRIELRQRPRAEADVGVAAASILARDGFLAALAEMRLRLGMEVPKGSSPQAREAAVAIARKHGPAALLETVKCHFKTTDEVLASLGLTRDALGPDGRAVSRAARPRPV